VEHTIAKKLWGIDGGKGKVIGKSHNEEVWGSALETPGRTKGRKHARGTTKGEERGKILGRGENRKGKHGCIILVADTMGGGGRTKGAKKGVAKAVIARPS